MNELSLFYRLVETFCNDHSMVEGFQYLDSVDKIDEVGVPYLRVIVFPTDFQILEDTYSITYGIVLQDKVRGLDPTAHVKSSEKLMFVLGQLEEHLYSHDKSITISNGDFMPNAEDREGENVTSAVASVTINVHRFNNTDIAFDEDSYFKPITFKVLPVDDTSSFSLSTSNGLCTWKFYSDAGLEAEYETNSVAHTWGSSYGRYFELHPPNDDWSLITGVLDFGNKNLYGEIPKIKLPNVTQLNLRNNTLTGVIPDIQLENATRLFLNDNDLSGFSTNLSGCKNLDLLYIYNNPSLSGDISNFDLPKLRLFYSIYTKIHGFTPRFTENAVVLRLSMSSVLSSSINFIGLHPDTIFSDSLIEFRLKSSMVVTSDRIDFILKKLDESGMTNGLVDLSGGINASPSATGLTYVTNLLARGNTVTTN